MITAEVPLAEMFGYSNDLRSSTQGKGTFSMEFLKYQKLPSRFQEEIVKKAQTLAKVGAGRRELPASDDRESSRPGPSLIGGAGPSR